MENKSNKQGVSLIVLVITIIVMIILAGTIILTLDNTGVIDRANEAVEKTNLAEVQNLASLKWAEAFMAGKTTQQELETEVLNALNNEKIDLTKYDILVTEEGVFVTLKKANIGNPGEEQQPETPTDPDTPTEPGTPTVPDDPEPESWVIATVDTVPIPKGFVASQATGENTKNGGLVIYEGTEPVTDANVETARKTRNQYVWVPVEDFSKFIRQNFTLDYEIGNQTGYSSEYWEIKLDTATNTPLSSQTSSYVTSTTKQEAQEMYASVKEYKGFYIARYEMGIATQRTKDNDVLETNVYSMMGKIPYTYIPWTKDDKMYEDTKGAVQVARNIYPKTSENYGVISTLTYGVQWDATLQWWLDTKAVTSVTNSESYGNYIPHEIKAGGLNEGAMYALVSHIEISGTMVPSMGAYTNATSDSTKGTGVHWLLTTGALKAGNINNIYDMAGNVREWTMEGSGAYSRVVRGDSNLVTVQYKGVALRMATSGSYFNTGFRPTLYIKLQEN